VLLWVLARRVAGLDLRGIASVAARSLVGSAVAAGVAIVVAGAVAGAIGKVQPAKLGDLAQAVAATLAGGLAYLGVSVALRIPELGTMLGITTDLMRRRGRA
jgi:hypothetical protein